VGKARNQSYRNEKDQHLTILFDSQLKLIKSNQLKAIKSKYPNFKKGWKIIKNSKCESKNNATT
jgi:hypothetical protein